MATTALLTQGVVEFFEEAGLMFPPVNKKRKISVTALPSSASSSRSSSSSGRISSASFSATYQNTAKDFIEFPEDLYSCETYQFLGFDEPAAEMLWKRYLTGDPTNPFGGFVGYFQTHIEWSKVQDAESVHDDWWGAMRKLGVNETLQEAIMAPGFDDIRTTATCKQWLLFSMASTFETLEGLNDQLRLEQAKRQHLAKIGRREMSPPRALSSPRSRKGVSPPPQVSTTISSVLDVSREGSAAVDSILAEAPESSLGHTMIWRAGLKDRTVACCTENADSLTFDRISSAPGDFSGKIPVVYFSPQRETADMYAMYLKHIAPITEIAVLQLAVPNEFVQSLSVNYLWSEGKDSARWKEVIWNSRRSQRLPKHLNAMLEKELWIGHIAHSPHKAYHKMQHFNEVSPEHALTVSINGRQQKAVQWVFHDSQAEDLLAQECKRLAWVHPMGMDVECILKPE